MNDLDTQNQVNKVTTPDEAVSLFVGEQFVEWAQEYIRHEMKAWPGIVTIALVTTRPEKIKKFLLQVFLADQAFLGGRGADPGLLGFAIANLSESDDPEAEAPLEIMEKLQTELIHPGEEGLGDKADSIHESWARLLQALGATEGEIERTKVKEAVRNYTSELSELFSNSSWQMTIGAFAGCEWVTLEFYKLLAAMIKRNTSLTDKDMPVLIMPSLDEKEAIDIGRLLDKAVVDSEDKQQVWTGLHRQLLAYQELINSLAKYLD